MNRICPRLQAPTCEWRGTKSAHPRIEEASSRADPTAVKSEERSVRYDRKRFQRVHAIADFTPKHPLHAGRAGALSS